MGSRTKSAIIGGAIAIVVAALVSYAVSGSTHESQNTLPTNQNPPPLPSPPISNNTTGKHLELDLHESVGIKSK